MYLSNKHPDIKPIFIVLIVLLAGFLVFSGSYGPSIENNDNFFYIYYTHIALTLGSYYFPYSNALTSNYFQIFGMGLVDILFKKILLSSVAFEFIMLCMTIIVIYLIGKRLFGNLGGLLSAFAYTISPLVLIETKTVGDVIPVTFFISLAMLLYLLHSDKKHGAVYLLLSGFVATAGMLVVYLSLLILPAILILILAEHIFIRKERSFIAFTKDVSLFTCGVLLGITALVFVSYASIGRISEPFAIFIGYFSQLKTPPVYNPFIMYLSWLFGQYSFNGIYGPIMANYLLATTLLTIAFGFYLFKKALIPAGWIFSALVLLPAITSSETIVPLERYIVMFIPAMSLIIGGGIAKLATSNKSNLLNKRYLLNPIMKVATILIILIYSLISAHAIVQAENVSGVSYFNFMKAYKSTANGNSTLYALADQAVAFQVYTNFSSNVQILLNISCGGIMHIANGSYVAIPTNYNITCGMPIVYYPNKNRLVEEYGTRVGNGIYGKLVYIIKIVK